MQRTLFIVNPTAGGGSTPQTWKRFQTLFADEIPPQNIVMTSGPGHARAIACDAHDFDTLVAVGGDGTAGEVASGIMDAIDKHNEPRPGQTAPRLALVPTGAGNDTARTLSIDSLEQAVAVLKAGRARPYDLLRVDCINGGLPARRYAMMFANAGFSTAAFATPLMKRLLGGRAAYNVAIFLKLWIHRSPVMSFVCPSDDEGRSFRAKKWTVLFASIETAGGGAVRIAPGARFDDGKMMVTVVPDRPKLNMLFGVLPKIAAGRHINEPGFDFFSAPEATISSEPECEVEIDGDAFGMTPATFTLCPGALSVLC